MSSGNLLNFLSPGFAIKNETKPREFEIRVQSEDSQTNTTNTVNSYSNSFRNAQSSPTSIRKNFPREGFLPLKERAKLLSLFHSKETSNSELSTASPPISKKDIILLDFQAPNGYSGGNRLLHVKVDTKIEKVIKQLCGLLGKNSPNDFSLVIPSNSRNDDIYLLPEYSLWMYDLVGVTKITWYNHKESNGGISPSIIDPKKKISLKIIFPGYSNYYTFTFQDKYQTTISQVLTRAKSHPFFSSSISSNDEKLKVQAAYGLYLLSKEVSGNFLDATKTLDGCGLVTMDVIEMRKYPVIEATLLNSTTMSNISNSSSVIPLPDSIHFSPNIKVKELIQLLLSVVLQNSNSDLNISRYGILIIPATPKKMMTALSWMDDENNVSVSIYDLQPYDILLLKQKEIVNGKYVSSNVTTTYDYLSSKDSKKGSENIDIDHPINIKLMISQTPTSNLSNNSDILNTSVSSLSSPSKSIYKSKSITTDFTTLEKGEKILVEAVNVGFLNDKLHQKALIGRLTITNYQLIFTPLDPISPFLKQYFRISLGSIQRIDKIGHKKIQILQYGICIRCKDFRVVNFDFSRCKDSRRKLVSVLSQQSFCGPDQVFAFFFIPSLPSNNNRQLGWKIYDVEKEYNRMMLLAHLYSSHSHPLGTDFNEFTIRWRISTANNNFSICESYAKKLIVPAKISDETLRQVSIYRSKGRIPILTYLYQNGAPLIRSSQPKAGITSKQSVDDQLLVDVYRKMNPNAADSFVVSISNSSNENPILRASNSSATTLHIFDARPRKNAIANVATGGGYEDVQMYNNTVIEFMNIENIHVMRDSITKLYNLITQSMLFDNSRSTSVPNSNTNNNNTNVSSTLSSPLNSPPKENFNLNNTNEFPDSPLPNSPDSNFINQEWYNELHLTRWLNHSSNILEGVVKITSLIERGHAILLHCSDGWDRTPQVSSLVQICLDSYFRTMYGFMVLLEKEWFSFGHLWKERIGIADKNWTDDNRSPIFVQFMDCVFQIMNQYPCDFEFNQDFLIAIIDEVYSNKYGTFLFNTEKERDEKKASERTESVWNSFLPYCSPQDVEEGVSTFKGSNPYMNPFYVPSSGVIYPDNAVYELQFWSAYYMRWKKPTKRLLTTELRANMLLQSNKSLTERLNLALAELAKLKEKT